jgi:hypothetical protein
VGFVEAAGDLGRGCAGRHEKARGLGRFLNADDKALSKHVERFFDPRQFGGVPGIEHPPHFFSSQPSFRASCTLEIPASRIAR